MRLAASGLNFLLCPCLAISMEIASRALSTAFLVEGIEPFARNTIEQQLLRYFYDSAWLLL
jgi:hypothetical protein